MWKLYLLSSKCVICWGENLLDIGLVEDSLDSPYFSLKACWGQNLKNSTFLAVAVQQRLSSGEAAVNKLSMLISK